MDDSLLLLATALGGLVLSFIIVTFFDTDGITDDALSRDLHQMIMQMSTLSVAIVFKPLTDISNIIVDFLSLFVFRIKWVFAFALFLSVTMVVHYYHADILTILDDGWTCAIVPVLKNIVTPFLQVFRLVYALFIPVVNAFVVLHGQIFKAWYITAVKCNHRRFLNATGEGALAVKEFSASTSLFFGFSSTNKETGGNFMTNDFDFSGTIRHSMRALSMMEDVPSVLVIVLN